MVEANELDALGMSERLTALGKRVREARYEKGLSLEELGDKAGISPGLLSQIERGLGNPSYSTLVKLSHALDLSLSSFFDDHRPEASIVVRRDQRKKLIIPGMDIIYELLSPDRNKKVEVTRWGVPAGFGVWDLPGVHDGEETIILLQGKLDIKVGDQLYHLAEGDSIYVGPRIPHWYGNPGDEVAICISSSSPPSS